MQTRNELVHSRTQLDGPKHASIGDGMSLVLASRLQNTRTTRRAGAMVRKNRNEEPRARGIGSLGQPTNSRRPGQKTTKGIGKSSRLHQRWLPKRRAPKGNLTIMALAVRATGRSKASHQKEWQARTIGCPSAWVSQFPRWLRRPAKCQERSLVRWVLSHPVQAPRSDKMMRKKSQGLSGVVSSGKREHRAACIAQAALPLLSGQKVLDVLWKAR